jgi:hypothetical protein
MNTQSTLRSLTATRKLSAGLLLLLPLFVAATLPPRTQAQTKKKIVFLAGPKDHGAVGRHEYEKDLKELAWSLENAKNLSGIETKVFVGKAPRDLSVLEDAAAIVIDGSGDWQRNETNVLFQQFQATDGRTYDAETTAYLQKLDQLVRQKQIGISIFHYTMWVENWVGRNYYLKWLGGLWIPVCLTQSRWTPGR